MLHISQFNDTIGPMKSYKEEAAVSQIQVSLLDFLKSYNKNIPENFPRASADLLRKFKESHPSFFKHGDLWSLDEHRKKIIDWLPLNKDA
jgi:hypothetical protein